MDSSCSEDGAEVDAVSQASFIANTAHGSVSDQQPTEARSAYDGETIYMYMYIVHVHACTILSIH